MLSILNPDRRPVRIRILDRTPLPERRGCGEWRRWLGAQAHVGSQIGNQASLDARNYGYPKLIELIEATEPFEVKRQNQIVLLQDNRRA